MRKRKNFGRRIIKNKLIQNWETEVAEFKEAGKDYDKNKIGQYFSAISNEANLKGLQHGWLVFGVRNKNKELLTIPGAVHTDLYDNLDVMRYGGASCIRL